MNPRPSPGPIDLHDGARLAAARWTLWRTLARGLAHTLANASQMLALEPAPAGAREEARERIDRAIARLAIARSAPAPEPVLPAEVLAELEACQSLQIGWPSTPIEFAVPSELPVLAGRADDMLHALLAVVTNAKEAADGRARIRISARIDGGRVEIRCEDGGPGIPDHVRARAFEPSAVPRDAAHLGLGLWSARALLRRNGGDVTLGEGSLVSLHVPAWRCAEIAAPAIR